MDPYRFTTLAHGTHDFCNPVSAATLDRFVETLALTPGSRVLDAGCGKGELLIRVVRRWGACGIGVDINPAYLAEAKKRGAAGKPGLEAGRDGNGPIVWTEAQVAEADLAPASFDLAICVGSAHVFGDLRTALAALRALTRPGGQVLLGHGYWKREPDPAYLAAFGATPGELGSHADNLAAIAAAGFETTDSALSSPEEWDAYEGLYAENIENFCAAHPEDPDRDALLERSRSWHALYRRWGRDTMGFGLYRLKHTGG